MEVAKRSNVPLEFFWGDVKVKVKPQATSGERMDIAYTPSGLRGVSARFKLAARIMVLGWEGLTRNGEDVPYSPEELDNVPDMRGSDGKLLLFANELGRFIWDKTDISGREEGDLKKDSALPPTGPAA